MDSSPAGQARETSSLWAAAVPLLCAVHCLAAPMLAVVAPALALPRSADHAVQVVSALVAAVIAWSGLRVHGRRAVLAPMAAGVALWIGGEAMGVEGTAEIAAHVAGGLLLAAGMAWNGHLRHQASCHHCGCPAHHHD